MNDLRNAVAHSFFPENLRGGKRATFEGADIFTLDGFLLFHDRADTANDYFIERLWGRRIASQIRHLHDVD